MAESMPRAMLRMLSNPRAAFDSVLERGGGFNWLFLLLFIELLIERRELVSISGMRAFAAPVAALSTFLRYGIGAAFFVFAAGVVMHYASRGQGRKVDMETGAALVTLAWVPHTVWIALSVLVAHLGFNHPLMPHAPARELTIRGELWQIAGLVIEYAPVALFAFFAYRHARRGETGVVPSRLPLVGPVTAGLLVTAVLTLNVRVVRANWDSIRPVTTGDVLPHAHLAGLDGGELDTLHLRGQVVLVDFWATWCGPCRQSMPILADIEREFRDQPFTLLSVNVEPENPQGVRDFLRENDLRFPVHVDRGFLAERMHVDTLPTAFLVDGRGVVRDMYVGAWGTLALRKAIEGLLNEARASTAQAK